MSQTTPKIEVKTAFHVTKDAITETSAFTFDEAGTYNSTDTTYYLTEKGWRKANNWDGGVVFTQEEANEAKNKKVLEHIEYLKKQSEMNAVAIAELEATL